VELSRIPQSLAERGEYGGRFDRRAAAEKTNQRQSFNWPRRQGERWAWQNAALRAIFASFASFFVERALFATVMVFANSRYLQGST
jgi:hypothetical protein